MSVVLYVEAGVRTARARQVAEIDSERISACCLEGKIPADRCFESFL